MVKEFKASGITEDTPKNIMFGAGTIHSGLSYGEHYIPTTDTTMSSDKTYYEMATGGGSGIPGGVTFHETEDTAFVDRKTYFEKLIGWNGAQTIIGATSGGTKLSIKPEFSDIEVDGATVKVKGLAVKIGETASLETNIIEVTPSIMKSMVVGKTVTSSVSDYSEIISTPQIRSGDYISNFGYVGKTLAGKAVIVIFDNALCTSGLEIEGKNKESSVLKATFECYADLSEDPTTLPYHIYYPLET